MHLNEMCNTECYSKSEKQKIFLSEKVSVTTFRTEIQQTKNTQQCKTCKQICYLRTDIEQRYCSTVTAQVTYL